MEMLKVKLLSKNAEIPSKSSSVAAGFDIYSAITCEIAPGKSATIKTDVQVFLPEGTYGRIAPKSKLSKKLIHVLAGVVDFDFRGEIEVHLYNLGEKPFTVIQGMPIAQIICEKIVYPTLLVIK